MSGCRGCSTQEEVEAASAIRRAAIEEWRQQQLVYDREAHGFGAYANEVSAEEVAADIKDNFWKEPDVNVNEGPATDAEGGPLTLVGTMEPQPDVFEPSEEKEAANDTGGTFEPGQEKEAANDTGGSIDETPVTKKAPAKKGAAKSE